MGVNYKKVVETILENMDALQNNYNAVRNDRFMSDEEKQKTLSEFDHLFVETMQIIMEENGLG